MKKLFFLSVSLLLMNCLLPTLYAQTNNINGTVTATDGTPLVGVTVTVLNTTRATITNEQGAFSIQADDGQVLEFSSVGYLTQTKVVSASKIISVILTRTDSDLDEVVVVGYGTQRKGNLTGSVVNVDVEKTLGSRPIADAGRGLQGLVPGLSVRLPDGEVGSDPLMRIRGFVGSVQGSSQPLVLVDNVEVPSIQMINPNDIESITVLKDAASASIYGAKAAFGVILITTKKGAKIDGNKLTYSNNFSWQNPFKKIEIAGIDGLQYTLDAHNNMKGSGPAGGFWRISDESIQLAKEWQQKYGGTVGPYDEVVYGRDWYFDGSDKYGIRIYDPVDAMIKKNAFTQNHNLSLNGRSGNTSYNLGVGYFNQQGMMKPAQHDDYTRYTANLKISTKVSDYITIRGGAMYTDRIKRYPNSSTGFNADPWLYLYRWSLLFPTAVKEHGVETRDPYWDTKKAHTAIDGRKYMNLNFGTTIDINKNWDIIADYVYDNRIEIDKSSKPTYTGAWHWYAPVAWNDENGNRIYVDSAGNITQTGGMPAYMFPVTEYYGKNDTYIYQSTWQQQRHTVNAYSTYRLNAEKHAFKFMAGTNLVALKWDSHWSRVSNLINEENPQFNYAVGTQTTGGNANWESLIGYFGRINYAFDNKYLLEGNLRYDASSKFPAHLRWNWYPSFSAGWVITNENFASDWKDVLSFAKLRGSWGSIGDQSVSSGLYISQLGAATQNSWLNSSGEQFFQLGTPTSVSQSVTWQDIATLDFGIDLKFFKNKFGIVFDWYERNTNNMLISGITLPATAGKSSPISNYGNLRTRGWEIALDFNHRFENGIGINATANLSDAITMITGAPDRVDDYNNRKIDNTWVTGKRYGDIYGYVTDRLYQKEDFVYDGSGNIVQETIIWNGVSKVTNKQAGNNPVYQTYFEDGNQILLISPGDVKFVDVNGDGYITPGSGTFGDPGDRVVIGNVLPRYEYGGRIAIDYKGFDLAVIGQGVGKRAIWGSGQLAIPGFHVKDGAMPQAIAEDYWRADRTDAFYPRAWNLGGSNSGFVMVPQTRYLLNMAYFRIKNITLGYNLSPKLLDRIKIDQARIYVSFENFITFDKLRGLPIDPEAISGYSMLPGSNYNLGRTGTSNPTFKIASVGVNISL